MNKKIKPHTAIIGAIMLTCSTVFIRTADVVGQAPELFALDKVPGEGGFLGNPPPSQSNPPPSRQNVAPQAQVHMFPPNPTKSSKKDNSEEEQEEGQNGDSANGGGNACSGDSCSAGGGSGGGAASSGGVCSGGSCSAGGGGGGGGAASSGGGGGGAGGGGGLGQIGSLLGGLAGGGGNQGQNKPSQPGQGSPPNTNPAPGTDKGEGEQIPNPNGSTAAGSPNASGARPAVPELRPVGR